MDFKLSEPAGAVPGTAGTALEVWKNLLMLMDLTALVAAVPPDVGLIGAAVFCIGSTVTLIPFAVGRLLKPERLSLNSFNFSRALTLEAARLLLINAFELSLSTATAPESLVDKLLPRSIFT